MTGARSSDPLRAGLAAWLREHDDDALVDEVAPDYLRRRLSSLVLSLGAPSAPTTTTGAGVGSGPGDEPAPPRALDDAQPPPAPVVPVPDEAAAVSPGSPAAASSSQGARPTRGARPSLRAAVLAAVQRAEGGCSALQIADALGCTASAVTGHLRELVAEGLVAVGMNGAATWSTRYATTQAVADEAARAARRGGRFMQTTAPHATGARATRTGRDEHGAGPVAQPAPPAVADEVDDTQVDEAPARRPLEQLLADEAAAECAARAREASDAARRASLARAVPPPPPGLSGGRLAEPPPRPRHA